MASTDTLALARRRLAFLETARGAEPRRNLIVSPYRPETMRLPPRQPQQSTKKQSLTVSRQSHTFETHETARTYLADDDAAERAAIQSEGIAVQRIRKRMMSWARPDDLPQPGDYCGCCSGSLWWMESEAPRGWCCCRCHPPVHLQAGQFRVVAT